MERAGMRLFFPSDLWLLYLFGTWTDPKWENSLFPCISQGPGSGDQVNLTLEREVVINATSHDQG